MHNNQKLLQNPTHNEPQVFPAMTVSIVSVNFTGLDSGHTACSPCHVVTLHHSVLMDPARNTPIQNKF